MKKLFARLAIASSFAVGTSTRMRPTSTSSSTVASVSIR